MEPNKMEQNFRKKLNDRAIQPSESAWDRLDAMLSVAENKKPKRNFRWLFVAAGFALFFTVGLFLYPKEKTNPEIQMDTPEVVISDENTTVSEQPETSKKADFAIDQRVSEMKQDETIAENQMISKVKKKVKSDTKTATDFQQQSVKEATAEVLSKPESEVQMSVATTEKLLVNTGKPKAKSQVNVDAGSLLSSVEGELNQEFRETTLQRLSRNFKTVKTAVANRNYE